jgi:tRNA A-37 threonylcarbamoyl transferase component Bud32
MASTQTPMPPGVSLGDDSASLNMTFEDLYQLGERLRSGSYGVVYTCQHKLNAEKTYAVKILDRTKLKKQDDESVFREVAIMKELAGLDNVVQLIDFFVSPEKLYMVQVFAAGGDVFDRLAQRTLYNEKDSRDLAECLLKTIQALHDRKIVHRDLKPENLLLANTFDDCEILLADFGFACLLPEDGRLTTRCGTPGRYRMSLVYVYDDETEQTLNYFLHLDDTMISLRRPRSHYWCALRLQMRFVEYRMSYIYFDRRLPTLSGQKS